MTDEPLDASQTGEGAEQQPAEAALPDPIAAAAGGPPAPTGLETPSAEPPSTPQFDPAATAWAAVAATPPKPAGPMRLVVIPLLLLVAAMLLNAFTALRVIGDRESSYAAGYLFGGVIGVFIVAGIAFLIARLVLGRDNPARLRLIATATALVLAILGSSSSIAASISAGTTKVSADPGTAMVISSPYTLTAATPQVEQSFSGASQGKVAVVVKMVTDPSGANVGIMVTTQGEQSDAFWKGFDNSFSQSSGGGATTPTQFHGSTARAFHSKDVFGYAWIESGSILVGVYAKSDSTALAIAEAQFQAMSAPAPSK